MKKNTSLLLFLTLFFQGFCQEDAWVYFTDKPNASYYLSNPLEMLTQRALDRRNSQNITLDVSDVPVSTSYINQIEAIDGITVMAKSKWFNAIHVRGTVSAISSITNLPFVASIDFANASLNARIPQTNSGAFSPVQKNWQIDVDYNYGNSLNQIEMLNGTYLHQQNFTGQNKIIAVLDSGFSGVNVASPFQNLVTQNRILGGFNFPDQNTNYFSRHNHGTMVLSCMGGFQSNQLIGTAPDASYYLFITEDINSENPVEESYWVEAAELADYYGADIINTSLGYFDYDNPAYSHTYADMNGTTSFISKGANKAFSKGMIVVVSAGNSGNTSHPNIGSPADAIYVLTVGAVDSQENYVSFSSRGPSFDGRVKPDVCAKGLGTTISTTTGAISTASGTSFSSPVVAGMVASFWSAFPSLTNAQIIQFVKESSDSYENPSVQKGYGIPDFQVAFANAEAFVNQMDSPLVVYPNPVLETLNFSKPFSGIFQIFDVTGKRIHEVSLQNVTNIDLSFLQSGWYIYDLQTVFGNQKGKIIKE